MFLFLVVYTGFKHEYRCNFQLGKALTSSINASQGLGPIYLFIYIFIIIIIIWGGCSVLDFVPSFELG